VLDQYQWLSFWVDARAVERVAGYDANIGREVFLKGGNLGGFARCLSADNGSQLGG
jgi:hypothetical protein